MGFSGASLDWYATNMEWVGAILQMSELVCGMRKRGRPT